MTYVLTFPERKLQWPYSTFGVTWFDVTISRTRLGDREVFQYCETNVKTSQNKTHQKRLVAITWSFRNISSSHWRNWNLKPTNIYQNALMKPATMIWSKCPVDLWLFIYMSILALAKLWHISFTAPPQAGWKTVTFESRSVLLGSILKLMTSCWYVMS